MKNRKILIAVLVALVATFFIFDLGRFFSLEYLKSQQAALDKLYTNRPLMVIAVFFFGLILENTEYIFYK